MLHYILLCSVREEYSSSANNPGNIDSFYAVRPFVSAEKESLGVNAPIQAETSLLFRKLVRVANPAPDPPTWTPRYGVGFFQLQSCVLGGGPQMIPPSTKWHPRPRPVAVVGSSDGAAISDASQADTALSSR
ncbi:hypothetical protein N7519_002109 [Penicillium mononematosum]|uniref:uncharacterized protein n=1 Tax=Penicillium mononematosum TaxID=268346 RepID=UPI00254730FE|nr:uncharacterized protein N7519_002109 [Penicillium mononematosum]KAJ6187201.1 hypothetical protein N7519_002109 [Penicillium mononematosum]